MIQTIQITGLTCAACQKLITKRIMKIAGVDSVSVELSGNTDIVAVRAIANEEITKVLEGTQYKIV